MPSRLAYVEGDGWQLVDDASGAVGGSVGGSVGVHPPATPEQMEAGRVMDAVVRQAVAQTEPLKPGPFCFGSDVAVCSGLPNLTLPVNPFDASQTVQFDLRAPCQATMNALCVILGVTLLTVAAVVAVKELL